jgi:hypothetical protein
MTHSYKPHPVLSNLHELEISAFSFWKSAIGTAYFDLHLVGEHRHHWLRFAQPRALVIEMVPRRGGLFLVDLRDAGLEDVTVQAIDVDSSPGSLRFFAASVVELAHNVWVFHGNGATFSSAVFRDEQDARSWIADNGASGTLTGYMLDQSAYDWAVSKGYFLPKREDQREIRFIERFTSAHQAHWHFTDGRE